MNSKIKLVTLAALATGAVCAMPTKQQIAEARSLVAELMAPSLADLQSKTKTSAEIAEVSVGFAESAKSEAVRYLLLRGAISYYIRGGDYGKAAEDFFKQFDTTAKRNLSKEERKALEEKQKAARVYKRHVEKVTYKTGKDKVEMVRKK